MENLTNSLDYFRRVIADTGWVSLLVQWLLIGGVIYLVVRFLRGTRGARLLRGIAFVLIALYVVIGLLSDKLGAIQVLADRVAGVIAFAIIVVFQPELRRAIMRLGETSLFRGFSRLVSEEIEQLVEAAMFLSKRKIGALIAIEREVGLGGLAESGTRVNADLTAPLLNTIFWPNSPLHDLGVIISGGKVAWAGVQFPLAEEGTLERELGSRHRAAVGMSQESDAVVLVVSEETGDISIAERGQLFRKLTPDALRGLLIELLGKHDHAAPSPGQANSAPGAPAAAETAADDEKKKSGKLAA